MASHRGVDSGDATASAAAAAPTAAPAAAPVTAPADAAAVPVDAASPAGPETRSGTRLRGDDGGSLRAQHLGDRPAPEAFQPATAAGEPPTTLELDMALRRLQHDRRVDHEHLNRMWHTLNTNSDILTAVVAELNELKKVSGVHGENLSGAMTAIGANDVHLKQILADNDAKLKGNHQKLKDEMESLIIDYAGTQGVIARHMARAQELHTTAEHLHGLTQTALLKLQGDFEEFKKDAAAAGASEAPRCPPELSTDGLPAGGSALDSSGRSQKNVAGALLLSKRLAGVEAQMAATAAHAQRCEMAAATALSMGQCPCASGNCPCRQAEGDGNAPNTPLPPGIPASFRPSGPDPLQYSAWSRPGGQDGRGGGDGGGRGGGGGGAGGGGGGGGVPPTPGGWFAMTPGAPRRDEHERPIMTE